MLSDPRTVYLNMATKLCAKMSATLVDSTDYNMTFIYLSLQTFPNFTFFVISFTKTFILNYFSLLIVRKPLLGYSSPYNFPRTLSDTKHSVWLF